jgi:hypothetical protein
MFNCPVEYKFSYPFNYMFVYKVFITELCDAYDYFLWDFMYGLQFWLLEHFCIYHICYLNQS